VSGRNVDLIVNVGIAALLLVALLEAARIGAGGLAVVIGIALAGVVARGILGWRKPRIVLRSDIANWLERSSAVTGEDPTQLAHRAISAYRADLGDGPRG
jgi:hypothetical protein